MGDIELACSCYEAGDYVGAEAVYLSAVRADPSNGEAIFGLGRTSRALGKIEAAILCYRRVIDLDPDNAAAHCNLGGALQAMDYLDEAESCLREAIRLDPYLGVAHNNLGIVLYCKGDDLGAEASYRRSLEICPNNHYWHDHLGTCLNRQGDLVRGWEEYSWGWRKDGPKGCHRSSDCPPWDGSSLDGRTILVYDSYGIGDAIQMMRFVSSERLRNGKIIVECRRPLMNFMASHHGVDLVIASDDPLPDFDVQAPLLALLGTMGTTIDTIPAQIPYLSPDPDRFAHWASRLDEISRGFRVGVHWHGSPSYFRIRQKSFPLACCEPLARIPAVTLVSLQRGYGVEQLRDCRFPVIDFGDEVDPGLKTFDDTPALIANLDLVVTADTCIAHTAGALGVPVWIALPYSPDWRWFRDRTDSPWYPTARLFRQSKPGDWSGVFEEIVEAIRELLR